MEILNLSEITYWADKVLFLLFTMSVSYLFIFALASLKKIKLVYPATNKLYRYAVFIPSKSGTDEDVIKTIESFEFQEYPRDFFDLIIISDGLETDTIAYLNKPGIIYLERKEKNLNRRSMLKYAINQIKHTKYDIAVLMKPSNTVDSIFLNEINKAYHSGGMAIQTHKVSKKMRSNINILSAIAEEINNSIFRRGHVNLGFSSSLIGSGMVFNYDWFEKTLSKLGNPGLTKQLESALLKQCIYIEYLEDIYTYEDKVKNIDAYNKQRENWSKTKRYTLKDAFKDFPKAFFSGNFDYCDKIIQWIMPSRILLITIIVLAGIFIPYLNWALALKWWVLLAVLLFSFSLSIPEKFISIRTFWAIVMIPFTIINVLINKFFSLFKSN